MIFYSFYINKIRRIQEVHKTEHKSLPFTQHKSTITVIVILFTKGTVMIVCTHINKD